MKTTFTPSNPAVRAIYCISLFFIAYSLFRKAGIFNFNVGGALMLVIALAPTVVLFLLVAFRFFGVAIGKFKLNVIASSGRIFVLRMAGIFLMLVSISIATFAVIGMLSSGHSNDVGYALVSGILGGGSPIGLILFEASRLLEREVLVESKLHT